MSLFTGLISEWRLGGIINLSGRLVMKDKVKEVSSSEVPSDPHRFDDIPITFKDAGR